MSPLILVLTDHYDGMMGMMDYEGPFGIEGRHVPLNPEGVVTSVAEGEGAGIRCFP